MDNKKHIRLPKDGLVQPEDSPFSDGNDVEGHGLPLTAPPSFGATTGPSHGGEIAMPADDSDDDVEDHIR